ncbi:MAG: DNA repair protein RecO [Pseudomonadota bacterium]
MARIEAQPALVLHTRPYRESSLLVDLLTARHGRVAAVLKGGRARLQVFSTFQATWYGKELVTLATPNDVRVHWLTGLGASAGLYLNEVLVRTLREREPVPELFALSCWAIAELVTADRARVRTVLRTLERRLLQTLGYGIDYARELGTGTPIELEACYLLQDSSGFVPVSEVPEDSRSRLSQRGFAQSAAGLLLTGGMIDSIAAEHYEDGATAAAARRLYARCLQPLLGTAPLKSRELLRGMAS